MPAHKPTPDIFKIITSNQRYFVFYRLALNSCFVLTKLTCECLYVCVSEEEDMEYQSEQFNGEKIKIRNLIAISMNVAIFCSPCSFTLCEECSLYENNLFCRSDVAGAWSADLIEKISTRNLLTIRECESLSKVDAFNDHDKLLFTSDYFNYLFYIDFSHIFTRIKYFCTRASLKINEKIEAKWKYLEVCFIWSSDLNT